MRICQSILLGGFLTLSLCSPAVGIGMVAIGRECQDELRGKVSEAAGLFPKEAETSRKQLISFGESGIPFVAEIIQSDMSLDPIKKTFLIDVIASISGEKSGQALISLLLDRDPYVRGLATTYLAKRKLESAIPHLIKLLDDKEVYKTINQTHPTMSHDVLIRDVAIDALATITGRELAPRRSRQQQAKAWQDWWDKKQKLITK